MAPVNPEKRKDPPPKAKRTRKKQSKEEKLASEAQRNLTNYLTKPYTRCIEVVPTYYHSIQL